MPPKWPHAVWTRIYHCAAEPGCDLSVPASNVSNPICTLCPPGTVMSTRHSPGSASVSLEYPGKIHATYCKQSFNCRIRRESQQAGEHFAVALKHRACLKVGKVLDGFIVQNDRQKPNMSHLDREREEWIKVRGENLHNKKSRRGVTLHRQYAMLGPSQE